MSIRPRRMRIVETQRPGIDGDITHAEAAQLRYDTSTALAGVDGLAGDVAAIETTSALQQAQITALQSAVANLSPGAVPLPNISGRYLHLDATDLSAGDGARISTWGSKIGGLSATRGNTANQPQMQLTAINGRPGIVFSNSRNDSLEVSGFAPGSLSGTVAMVLTNTPTSSNRYAFGTNGSVKNVLFLPNDATGMQSPSFFSAPSVAHTPRIVVIQFGASGNGSLRINGAETFGSGVAPSEVPTFAMIGHRTGLNSGQGHDGAIGEVIYYDRAIGSGNAEALERYLSAKWGIPTGNQPTWYVDTIAGRDANHGNAPGSPVPSVERAWRGMTMHKQRNATVRIHAPAHAPSRQSPGATMIKDDGGTVRFMPLIAGDRWHLYGTTAFRGGWTHAGDGVYTRLLPIPGVTSPYAWVMSMPDENGNPTRIMAKNESTPTTPAPGEYGYAGDIYYLHLPGDANPNDHTVEICTTPSVMRAQNDSTLLIEQGYVRGGQNQTILSGSTASNAPGGFVHGVDTIAEGGLVGAWVTAGYTNGMRCTGCVGRFSGNDGFNHHAQWGNRALMWLEDCEGAWNDDEGVSPHDDTHLVLIRGRYHHNAYGGLTSVGNAVTNVFGTEFDHNRTRDQGLDGWDSGGVSILEQSTLISLDLYSHDNPGPGVEVDTAAGATWDDRGGTRSGTEHGNGAPDKV